MRKAEAILLVRQALEAQMRVYQIQYQERPGNLEGARVTYQASVTRLLLAMAPEEVLERGDLASAMGEGTLNIQHPTSNVERGNL